MLFLVGFYSGEMDVFSLILSDDDEVPDAPVEQTYNCLKNLSIFFKLDFPFFSFFFTICSLSEIFGVGGEEKPAKSLRYQAPKPTYPGTDESPDSRQQWILLFAKIASAYKVINHINVPQGKVGFALLKSPDELKMILYRDKENVLSSTMILEKFTIFTKDSYLQYQDDNSGLWSVIFETRQDFDEVIRILEPKCKIQREEKPRREGQGDLDEIKVDKGETDPEEKQNKQIKANILSRMAKMGKKIVLPKMVANSEVSDSSDNEGIKGEGSKVKPALPPRKQNSRAPITGQLQIAQMAPGPVAKQVGPVSTYSEPHIIPQCGIMITNNTESNLNLMLSENRIQSTELRFNLTKLDNKVDKILDKMELLSSGAPRNCLSRDEEIIELEEKILALKKENLNLKCKNRDLEAQCTRSPRKFSLEDQEAVKAENETVKKQNQDISIELITKNEEFEILNQKLQEKLELLEIKDQDLKAKDFQLESLVLELEEIREKLKEEQSQQEELRKQLEENSQHQELEYRREFLENFTQTDETTEVPIEKVRELMNNLYFKLCDKIGNLNDSELKQNEILKNIGQTIKQETNEALRKSQGLQ